MNQLELNHIAQKSLLKQSVEAAKTLQHALTEDLKERVDEIPGPAVHHIHNMALFNTVVWLNFVRESDINPKPTLREYLEYAESLRPIFQDIVDSLKDFPQTTTKNDNSQATHE